MQVVISVWYFQYVQLLSKEHYERYDTLLGRVEERNQKYSHTQERKFEIESVSVTATDGMYNVTE